MSNNKSNNTPAGTLLPPTTGDACYAPAKDMNAHGMTADGKPINQQAVQADSLRQPAENLLSQGVLFSDFNTDPKKPLSQDQQNAAKVATENLIKNASKQTQNVFANIGARLGDQSGKKCTTLKDKVFHVFECVIKAAINLSFRGIRGAILKEFVKNVMSFVNYCKDKSKSWVNKVSPNKEWSQREQVR